MTNGYVQKTNIPGYLLFRILVYNTFPKIIICSETHGLSWQICIRFIHFPQNFKVGSLDGKQGIYRPSTSPPFPFRFPFSEPQRYPWSEVNCICQSNALVHWTKNQAMQVAWLPPSHPPPKNSAKVISGDVMWRKSLFSEGFFLSPVCCTATFCSRGFGLGLKGYLNTGPKKKIWSSVCVCVLNVIFGRMSGVCDRFGVCWLLFVVVGCWLLLIYGTWITYITS